MQGIKLNYKMQVEICCFSKRMIVSRCPETQRGSSPTEKLRVLARKQLPKSDLACSSIV